MIGLLFKVLFTIIIGFIILGIVMHILTFFNIELPFGNVEGMSMSFANPFSMVVAIVAIVMITGLFRDMIKRRHEFSASHKELIEIKQRLTSIEAELADIKEQIADFIIKTN